MILSMIFPLFAVVEASASTSELRLRVSWGIRHHAVRRSSTQRVPVTKLAVRVDYPDTFFVPTTIKGIIIIVRWSESRSDLHTVKAFRRWIEERVEYRRSQIQNASLDIWQPSLLYGEHLVMRKTRYYSGKRGIAYLDAGSVLEIVISRV